MLVNTTLKIFEFYFWMPSSWRFQSPDLRKSAKFTDDLGASLQSGLYKAMKDYILPVPGWSDLYAQLLEDLRKIDPEMQILQSKEKFGELRVYLKSYAPGAHELIDLATQASRKTCQQCGQPGRLRQQSGFFATLCDVHGEGFEIVKSDPIKATIRVTGKSLKQVDRSKRL